MRRFLKMTKLAIAAMALSSLAFAVAPALAAPAAEDVRGWYSLSANLYAGSLNITSQSGNSFSGTMIFPGEANTPVAGTVTGDRIGTNSMTPITITFNRTLGDGTIQTYTGAVASYPSGPNSTSVLMAGVFFHNGFGPYPWRAQR